MKNEKEIKTSQQEEREWYRERIIEMVKEVEDVWILEQIQRAIINMTK